MKATIIKLVDGQSNIDDIERMIYLMRKDGFNVKWVNKDHYISFYRSCEKPCFEHDIDDSLYAI